MSQEVVAHVYDVANAGSDAAVLHINRFFKDAIGLGGIFHTAIQVYGDEEWSFGFCERGTGVFSCPPCKNPMYTFRESIVLGKTSCSIFTVNQIIRELSREWPGSSYELLSKNCNHFCNTLCEKLDCPKIPGWINRFANAGDAALEVAETTAVKLKQAKKEIVTACKTASIFLTGTSSSAPQNVDDTGSSENNSFFEGAWLKSIISISMNPSKSLVCSNDPDEEKSEDESESESDDDGPNSDHSAN
ncbi:hypothetical protein EJB05_46645 [Eragrostis curvula]|uniref:PPPDE domain-containing protein n=1 Tax=Eragrostis curvula TaxID=38414 RepID=A0A5J9TQ48_9POAL|nr:hypothetical protein EJB05_46645 [Eragrostis curvula]